MGDIQQYAVRAGSYLILRTLLGVPLGLLCTIVLTREIGLAAYGSYWIGAISAAYMSLIFQCGLGTWLVRAHRLTGSQKRVAFGLLIVLSTLATLSTLIIGYVLMVHKQGDVSLVFTAVCLAVPLQLVRIVPVALLERDLNFRDIAFAELVGNLVFCVVAIGGAVLKLGVWAPVLGWWMQQIIWTALTFWKSRWQIGISINVRQSVAMLRYGIGVAVSLWIWEVRALIGPWTLGRFVGLEAVGALALASRIVEALAFLRPIAWRVGVALMSRFQADHAALTKTLEQGISMQILFIGACIAGFSVIADMLLPALLGSVRTAEVLTVLPYLGVSYLCNSAFALYAAALYVLGRTKEVIFFHVAHVATLGAVAVVATPKLGLIGYGLAELTAIASYPILLIALVRQLGSLRFGMPLLWLAAFTLIILSSILKSAGETASLMRFGAMIAGVSILVLTPATWRCLRSYVRFVGQLVLNRDPAFLSRKDSIPTARRF